MNGSGILTEAWGVTKYFAQENRFDALRGCVWLGKVVNYGQGEELKESKLVKACTSALECTYPLELLGGLIAFGKAFQTGKTFGDKVFQFALLAEAFPRTYNVVADFFGFEKESIPGGKKVRTFGDVAGLYIGGKIAIGAFDKLQACKGIKGAEKVEQYAWVIFGLGLAIAEVKALYCAYQSDGKVTDKKEKASWGEKSFSLLTGSMTTLGFLTATYIKNTK